VNGDPVLITGCSTGIGRATAAHLAQRGWKVYASARRPQTLADLSGCEHLQLDVTDDASATAAVEQIEREHGSVGTLINNAGAAGHGRIVNVSSMGGRLTFPGGAFYHASTHAVPDRAFDALLRTQYPQPGPH
jgi:NADP-dependent 3-hydroxy acid dehydrogenase YdfG